MFFSNRFTYRSIGEYLIISKISDKKIYCLSGCSNTFFDSLRESISEKEALDRVIPQLSNAFSFHDISNNFYRFIEFLTEIEFLIGNIGLSKLSSSNKEMTSTSSKVVNINKLEFENKIPSKIQIEIESKCNFDCKHCYLNGGREVASYLRLKLSMIKELFDDFHRLGTKEVVFSGGEPFLRKDFIEILKLTQNYGFYFDIYTNGSLISDEVIRVLSNLRLRRLQISFYGSEKEYNTFTNTRGYYLKTLKVLDKLQANNIPFYLVIPLTKLNLTKTNYLDNLRQKYNCRFYSFILNSTYGKNTNISSNIQLSPQHEYCVKYTKELQSQKNSYKGRCISGITYAAINVKGHVYPCYEYNIPVGSLHNIRFQEIWTQSPDLKKIRKINLRGNINQFCVNCDYNEFCIYCFGKNKKYTGNYNEISHKTCRSAKYYYELNKAKNICKVDYHPT